MVYINNAGAPASTVPTVEQCKFITRIYPQGRGYPAEIRRMSRQGWKVVSVQEHRAPMRLERLRAESPGALTHVPSQKLMVSFMRCGVPTENRVKEAAMRFRSRRRNQA